jgi:hypothetical protein
MEFCLKPIPVVGLGMQHDIGDHVATHIGFLLRVFIHPTARLFHPAGGPVVKIFGPLHSDDQHWMGHGIVDNVPDILCPVHDSTFDTG